MQLLAWATIPYVIVAPDMFNTGYFLLGVFLIACIGSSAGLHRYFGHGSYKTGRKRHWLIAFLATISTQGSIAHWTEYHRSHHKHSDTDDDPIAPSHAGFLKAFFAIQDSTTYKDISVKRIVIQLRDPAIRFFHNWYWPTIFVYVVLLAVVDLSLVINMYLLPVGVVRIVLGLQNTFGHGFPKIGAYRNYETKDNSVNTPLVNMLTFFLGETLHNNHHANPGKYSYSVHWYEPDLTGWFIKHVFAKR